MRCAILTALVMLSSALVVLPIPCAGQQNLFSLRVTVTNHRGDAILGAQVHVVSLRGLLGLAAPNGTVSFKDVPAGTYQITAMYPGFKDKTVSDIAVIEGKTTELNIELEEGPPKASDFRIRETLQDPHSYAKTLAEIGQPSLCSEPIPEHTESYRLMWVPTFDRPAFLRVDVGSDGAATLLTHVWEGHGGYEWGKSVKTVRKLTWDEEGDMFETLADIGFWTLPAEYDRPPNVMVLDGTEWFIEGVKDGECHVVLRYASALSGLFQQQFLAKVAKLKPYYEPDR